MNCPVCTKEFVKSYEHRKYCSYECAKIANITKAKDRSKFKHGKETFILVDNSCIKCNQTVETSMSQYTYDGFQMFRCKCGDSHPAKKAVIQSKDV